MGAVAESIVSGGGRNGESGDGAEVCGLYAAFEVDRGGGGCGVSRVEPPDAAEPAPDSARFTVSSEADADGYHACTGAALS